MLKIQHIKIVAGNMDFHGFKVFETKKTFSIFQPKYKGVESSALNWLRTFTPAIITRKIFKKFKDRLIYKTTIKFPYEKITITGLEYVDR